MDSFLAIRELLARTLHELDTGMGQDAGLVDLQSLSPEDKARYDQLRKELDGRLQGQGGCRGEANQDDLGDGAAQCRQSGSEEVSRPDERCSKR